ncbi:uncharacterized protein LOC133887361 isoform X2 [Phragmites australis]|nr:uncharacterized protein LOC133887361 isoform X2 [Phragmites australis]
MEVVQHTSWRADDLDGRVPQPGQPGWLHPSLPALMSSSSTEPGEKAGWLPSSLSTLLRSSSSSESGEPGHLPPSILDFLRSSSSSSSESEDPGRSFELRCLTNLANAYLPVPPPPAPARKITPYTKDPYVLHARPGVILEKSKRFAKGALEHYNRRKKIKFELIDVMPVIMMAESQRLYTHVNFTARSSKEGSQEQLFFAELYNCGKRRAPSGFVVTCCEPLGSDSSVGHKGFQLDGTSAVRKNVDFTRCFACSPRIHHPKGLKYVAGHCNIPYIYDSVC